MNRTNKTDEAYQSLTLIHEGEETLVHRCIRVADGISVLRKSLRAHHPTPEQRSRQRHEYSLLAEFDSDAIVRVISLDSAPNGPVITLEDSGHRTLATRIAEGPLPLTEFFDLAQSLTRSLGEIHDRNIVHKDINPDNILWSVEERRAQIFDLGIASRLTREYSAGEDVRALEGTLAYLAPEQTGRTNRAIDWRADLYSLGATFYEALGGQRPFQAGDAMGLIHAHLAMQPLPLDELRTDIPPALWLLVKTLLAKSADDRYQSTRGIAQDLERIKAALENGSVQEVTTLDGIAVTDRFELPGRLYGRSTELKVLTDAYKRALDGRSGIVLIKGPAGTGKSALAAELRPIAAKGGGHFVDGKFDRYQRDTPYAPLMIATRSLVRQVLAESGEQVSYWRTRILDAVAPNGVLVTDSVPELQSLIGEQPPVAQLTGEESRNRFNVLLMRFFQSLAATKNPLVLFVDDLQWADLDSIELLRKLLTHNDTKGFLLVAAYRDDEVTATHPLTSLLEEVDREGVRSDVLVPGPFRLSEALAFISDATNRPENQCNKLAELLLNRSGGRPFFFRESLLSAYESQAIKFDPAQSAFCWDLAAIRNQSASGELGSLLAERIGRLPGTTRHLLGLASCMGMTFDLQMLAVIENRPIANLAREIEPAFESGLAWSLGLWRFDDDAEESHPPGQSDTIRGLCKFVHDEVQAAAYEQVDENARIANHLGIARILDDRSKHSDDSDSIFELVHQVTLARELVTRDDEKLRYAELFLQASRRASGSAAFATAARLVQLGRSLMNDEPWKNHYVLWLDLSRVGAEAAALSDNKEMLDRLVVEVRAHANNVLDQTDVVSAQISYFVAHLQPAQALSVAREALAPLGVVLPASANLFQVGIHLVGALRAMRGKATSELENLPRMQDPVHLAAMRILLRTISPAYIADPNMFPLIVLHMVRLSLRHGNSLESPFGFVTYGLLLSAGLGQLDKATELGLFALKLASADTSKTVEAKLAVTFYVTLNHWKNHLSDSLTPLLAGHHAGLETGDIEYACHSAWYYCNYVTWTGEPLAEVAAIQSNLIAAIDEHNSEFHSVCARIFNQMVQALANVDLDNQSPQQLAGDSFNECTDVAMLVESNNLTGLFNFHHCKAALNYFLGDCNAAMTHGLAARKFEQSVLGSTNVAQNTFYLALATLHEYPGMGLWQRFSARRRIRSYRHRLRRWGKEGPANYSHKYAMVEGNWHCLHGRGEMALACFDRARANARAGHFIHDEALATELLARCQLELGMPLAARENLVDAWTAWLSWGGLAVAMRLEEEFPQWLNQAALAKTNLVSSTNKRRSTGSSRNLADQLDADSTLKASQAMMEEIVLESLLEKLMRILIENAGAQAGTLMLSIDGVPHYRAFGDVDQDKYVVVDAIALHDAGANDNIVPVPLRVVDYVWRSGEIVVLDDAANDSRFADDELIAGRSPLSVLAAPIEHRGRLVGVIYLENSRTPGVFSEDRVNLIQVLAAQAAISIQNAKLYRDLEDQAGALSHLNKSLGRFVPHQFLASLGHDSVVNVRLGENMHREMSVLFSDIRGFTSLVESLEPSAHVDFINEYLSYMEPAIVETGGFVDSYIGDAIMALFDSADDAVRAALKMTGNLKKLNESRAQSGQEEMRIGIGISTGVLTLGTIGGPQRIKCGVIGDTVNLAARVESLTSTYGASLLISHHTKERLTSAIDIDMRQIERVTVKGQSQPVTLFEILDAAPAKDRLSKLSVLDDWNEGLKAFYAKDFAKASECFGKASSSCAGDLVARRFVASCWRYLDDGVPEDWDGVVALDHK